MKYKTTKEQLQKAVNESLSIANVCRVLDIRPCGGNYKTLYSKLKKWDISIEHFTGAGWNVGLKFVPNVAQPLQEILIENSTFLNSNSLKKRLFKEGLKNQACEICGITNWNNKDLVFEIHHINGDNLDHRIENIQILCPNCHSQTPTHKNKNKLSALSERREVEFRKVGESLAANAEPSLNVEEGVETLHGTPKL